MHRFWWRGRYWCVVVLVFEVEDEEVAVLVLCR